jgi:hypothetical protein
VSGHIIGVVGDVIVAGVLAWLVVFVWWGTELLLRVGRRGKVLGGFFIALALIPSLVTLWRGT